MQNHIHIISFANPFPPNYGGIIDVFYKIKALSEAGIKITLHIFEYHSIQRGKLEPFCEKVYYYPRPLGILYQFSSLPYIVNTRKSKQLLLNLLLDNDPILFDGLHSTYFLNDKSLADRHTIVRTHNVEHVYYSMLAQRETKLYRKLYFRIEAMKLKRYEKILKYANQIATISESDEVYFKSVSKHVQWVGAFHPFREVSCKTGTGNYVLYHGNLEVAENLDSVHFIINEIMSDLTIPLYIVGKNPPAKLYSLVKNIPNCTIVANPSDEEMARLIANAQINLLPTFQPTGLKLKLLYSLYTGRHVVVSPEMVEGSGLNSLCHICNSPNQFKETIRSLMPQPFDEQNLLSRKTVLNRQFSNQENVKSLINMLFPAKEYV